MAMVFLLWFVLFQLLAGVVNIVVAAALASATVSHLLRNVIIAFSPGEQHTGPSEQCLVGFGVPFDHRVAVDIPPASAEVGVEAPGKALVDQPPVRVPPETQRIEQISPEPQALDPILFFDVVP